MHWKGTGWWLAAAPGAPGGWVRVATPRALRRPVPARTMVATPPQARSPMEDGAHPHSTPPLTPGQRIGPGYEVIEHLSRGRRLDVYDAWSHERATRVIVKALRPERRADRKAHDQLIAEGELLMRFTHPHIVRGYEVLDGEPPAIVMETLPGETLAHLVEETQPRLSASDVAHLGIQLGSAIFYLHRQGILHLDLKPANAVTFAGQVKVIDLSLARPPGEAPPGIGTFFYLAPEQARGEQLGPPADVWGIGTILFELAALQPAFDDPGGELDDDSEAEFTADSEPDAEGGSSEWYSTTASESATWASSDRGDAEETGYPQLEAAAPPLASLRGDLPAELTTLVDRCLAHDPAARPRVPELLHILERFTGADPRERRFAMP